MNIKSFVFAACLMTAALAQAQNLQTIKIAPSVQPQLQDVQVDPDAQALRKLEIDNKKLREENARLQQENEALKQRVDGFTSLGGSEVRAYCPDNRTSRNTAGAESNCAAGGYLCDPVSGLCRNSCDTSDMCAANFKCVAQQCISESSLIKND